MRIRDLKEQEKLVADYEIFLDTIPHDIKKSAGYLEIKDVTPYKEKEFNSLLKIVDNALTKMHKIIKDLIEVKK